MKKAIVWLLALTLCLTLCACGDKQDSAAGTNPGTTAPTAGQQENKPTGTTPANTENTQPTQGGTGRICTYGDDQNHQRYGMCL